MAAEIGVPTVRGVQSGLMDYGAGGVAGVVYRTVSQVTGSSLVGGAISAALASSVTKGQLAPIIAVNMGFGTGLRGLQNLLGTNPLGNMLGGQRSNGNGANNNQPKINLI